MSEANEAQVEVVEAEKSMEPQAAAAAKPEVAPEPAPEPAEPEAPKVTRQRQWVTLRGTSMDARVGAGLLADMAHDIRSVVGKPKACALAHEPAAPAEMIETLRRGLTDQGFLVHKIELEAGEKARSVEAAAKVQAALAEVGITADDLVVAVGDVDSLSVMAFVCPTWCAGVPLVEVPLSLTAAVVAGATPRALSVAGHEAMVGLDAQTRFEICDLDVLCRDANDEDALLAYAFMVATAMSDCEKAVSKLWDRADDIVSGDANALAEQLSETIKSRGKVVASSSLAIRQSIAYGQVFASALRGLVCADVPASAILAESLRFSARLSVGLEDLSVDDMFTQDELLDKFGLGYVEAQVDAAELIDAIKAECFKRTNRLMLPLPRALGRVRLAAVDDDLLREHVGAWCEVHAPQA